MSSNRMYVKPQRYPRAVGSRGQRDQLGWSFLDWFSDYEKPEPLKQSPVMDHYWNAGVNMAYGRQAAYQNSQSASVVPHRRSGGDTDLKVRGRQRTGYFSLWGPPGAPGVEEFNRAKVYADYGNMGGAKAELGDLFNDIMGAVVPGWDARPEALKKIVVKPDPAKIVQAAQRIAPNAGADIVRAANANGLNVFVNTPAGQVEVTPYNAQNLYGMYPFLTKASGMLGSVPMWVWLAGGAGVVGLLLFSRK